MASNSHCPPHIKALLQDLKKSHSDTSQVLKNYISYLASDTTLFYIYLNLGYSPEHGTFLRIPSQADVLLQISKEFQDPIQNDLDFFSTQNNTPTTDCNSILREEFLRTFYENNIGVLSDATELGLKEPSGDAYNFEGGTITPAWNSKISSPIPSKIISSFTPLTPLHKQIQSDQNTPRMNRGLKVLSLRVKDIICQKGFSCYKEVADELIKEMELGDEIDREKEEKNILRRVYDALNVLIACDMVRKKDNRYYWKGITQEIPEKTQIKANPKENEQQLAIDGKRERLMDIANRFYAAKELIRRNKQIINNGETIPFPFIVVATEENGNNKVNIEFNRAKTEVSIKFQKEVKMFGDLDIVVKMNFQNNAYRRTDIPPELLGLISKKTPIRIVKKLIL